MLFKESIWIRLYRKWYHSTSSKNFPYSFCPLAVKL